MNIVLISYSAVFTGYYIMLCIYCINLETFLLKRVFFLSTDKQQYTAYLHLN